MGFTNKFSTCHFERSEKSALLNVNSNPACPILCSLRSIRDPMSHPADVGL
jgi:hypothetical protein